MCKNRNFDAFARTQGAIPQLPSAAYNSTIASSSTLEQALYWWELQMERELRDRAEAIQRRITQLRDSL
jgi:hypothetical protein